MVVARAGDVHEPIVRDQGALGTNFPTWDRSTMPDGGGSPSEPKYPQRDSNPCSRRERAVA